ncbi:MAG: hypothetical protein EZS28_018194, partial [Streblomastix strix]
RKIFTTELLNGVRERGYFNMDETVLSYKGKERIAKIKGYARSVQIPREQLSGHITFCPTISPGPRQPPTFVILGSLPNVPKNIQSVCDENQAHVTSSRSEQIQNQRLEVYFEKDEPILLILDGHYSRKAPGVEEIVQENNIRAVTFPDSLTQVLRPLDVAHVFLWGEMYYRRDPKPRNELMWGQMSNQSRTDSFPLRFHVFEALMDKLDHLIDSFERKIRETLLLFSDYNNYLMLAQQLMSTQTLKLFEKQKVGAICLLA